MTHEELLKKLWEKRNSLCDHLDIHFALSEVVELHRPEAQEHGQYEKCWNCSLLYPCPTIHAIRKKIKL